MLLRKNILRPGYILLNDRPFAPRRTPPTNISTYDGILERPAIPMGTASPVTVLTPSLYLSTRVTPPSGICTRPTRGSIPRTRTVDKLFIRSRPEPRPGSRSLLRTNFPFEKKWSLGPTWKQRVVVLPFLWQRTLRRVLPSMGRNPSPLPAAFEDPVN